MSNEFNLFAKNITQIRNPNQNQGNNFNQFGLNNNPNNIPVSLFGNSNINNLDKSNNKNGVKPQNNNINQNIFQKKKNLMNPKTFVKKTNNKLKESINLNLLSNDDFDFDKEISKKNQNRNIIYNNNYNKNKIEINKKNSNDINENPDLFKTVILFKDKQNQEDNNKHNKQKPLSIKKQKENEKNKAEIIDKLKCYICMDKLKEPRICKFCNRAACSNCLKIWFQRKHQCGFCRNNINYNDTIEIPIINDIADFFMKNMNNQKKPDINKKNKNISGTEISGSFNEEISLKLKQDENICSKHKHNYEFYCYQCNEKYCDKCLIILNDSAKIHKNHMIVSLDKFEQNNKKYNIIIEEMKKLEQSNLNIDNLIQNCEFKLKELEIEKNNFIDEIDFIKDDLDVNYEDTIFNINSTLDKIKSKENDFINSIDTTPTALKNIITLKDHGQGKEIYEHLSSLNKIAADNSFPIKLSQEKENLFIETFISEPTEIIIPKIVGNKLIIKEQTYNFIPNYNIKLSFENINNNKIRICVMLSINNNNHIDFTKIFCFIIFKKENYECDFNKIKQQISRSDGITLYSDIDLNIFLSLQDKNNKISFKLYIMVYKS